MAERVFARKMEKAGFAEVWIGEKVPYGIGDAALYPLFTPELIRLMERVIPPERRGSVAIAVIAKARRP